MGFEGVIISRTCFPDAGKPPYNAIKKYSDYIITMQAIYEPPRGKSNNVVSEQVRHKPTCTSTEAG